MWKSQKLSCNLSLSSKDYMEKGARYPQLGERIDAAIDFDYEENEFEGIGDNGALANAYKEGCDFYYFNEVR